MNAIELTAQEGDEIRIVLTQESDIPNSAKLIVRYNGETLLNIARIRPAQLTFDNRSYFDPTP